jgi:putative transcriptional regulator
MSRAVRSIKRGLEQAIAHQERRPVKIRIHRIPDIDVKAVREKTGLTQLEFAAKFAISPGTLRHWERGDRRPRGTSRVLLHIIDREPKTVLRALARNGIRAGK